MHDAAALEFTSKVVLVSVGPTWRLQDQVKERKICDVVIGNCKRQAKGSRQDNGGVHKWIKAMYASIIIMPER